MMKKINVLVRDRDTLVLLEDASEGDIIDLTSLSNVDFSILEQAIEAGKDKIYNHKLDELKQILKVEQEKENIAFSAKYNELKQQYEQEKNNSLNELREKYVDQIANLDTKIKTLEATKKNEIEIALTNTKNEYLSKIQEMKSQYNFLVLENKLAIEKINAKNQENIAKETNELKDIINKLQNELSTLKMTEEAKEKANKLEVESQYKDSLNQLKQENADLIQKNKSEIELINAKFETEKLALKANLETKYTKQIQEKEDLINNLKRQKASLNVKQTGEDLESWCDNEMLQYMQNGFFNCTWQKDNKVIKEDGEARGSKADYIFKVYAKSDLKEEEMLTSVCLEMKDENPDSVTKQTNEHYYAQLDKNRNKKGCKYALLVSNLEMDKPNLLPIFKVREYQDMYVVRPGYMTTFLNMVVSLTTRFSDLILTKEKQKLEIMDRLALVEAFENLKNTYLDKPLISLRKEIENISSASESIRKANQKIDDSCSKIITSYIDNINDKLAKFEVKIDKEYKKLEE